MSDMKRTSYIGGWRAYPLSVIGHHVQGAMAAWLILTGGVWAIAAVVWAAYYVAYQGLSAIRKKDAAGLDVADFIVGYVLCLAIQWVTQTSWGV